MSRMMRTRGLLICLSLSLFLFPVAKGHGSPNQETHGAVGNAVAVDSEGRIVVAGKSLVSAFETATVWRYTEHGILDDEFGGTGFVVLETGYFASSADGVEILKDGRIQVAGRVVREDGELGRWESVIYLLFPDGSPDLSFDTDGRKVVNDSTHVEFNLGRYMAIDEHGRAVTISRYSDNDTPEVGITENGLIVSGFTDPTMRSIWQFSEAVIIDAKGMIIVAGWRKNADGNRDMTIWRFDADGSPDMGFGEVGYVAYDSSAGGGGSDQANDIAEQGDGMLLVAGSSENSDGELDVVVWRLHENGNLDESFNDVGYVVRDAMDGNAGRDAAYGLTVDSQGRILVVGHSQMGTAKTDMILWRFHYDGTVDTSFGNRGRIVWPDNRIESE